MEGSMRVGIKGVGIRLLGEEYKEIGIGVG
jgi:hypothetical protein